VTNIKEKKVKKLQSDGKKLRELIVKHKAREEGVIQLAVELTEIEAEYEILQERLNDLEFALIEQRGVIGYLEHKLKGGNDESA
jgi:predicted RNase H-like nuclease (RuvC/YqgF family)